jgi:glycosyltransferase involved in cell wall biosynthesis
MNGNKINTPLVSVIMNCYNGEKYLEEAIDSVLKQTYTNWELIFWDNQSTDNSASIFKSYNDLRFKYFFAERHTKLGEGRNLAIAQSTGDWIAFLDCDDLWVNSKLEKQINNIGKLDSVGLIYTNVLYFSLSGKINHVLTRSDLPSGQIFEELVKDNFIPLSSALVKKDIYYEVGSINASYNQAEEYDLFVKISHKYNIVAIKEVLTKYRFHENNLSSQQKDLAFLESIEIIEKFLDDSRSRNGLKFWSSLFLLSCLKRGFFDKNAVYYLENMDLCWNCQGYL